MVRMYGAPSEYEVVPAALDDVVAVGAWLTVSPLAGALGFVSLPPKYWLLLAILLVFYVGLTQLMKMWFYRRFGN